MADTTRTNQRAGKRFMGGRIANPSAVVLMSVSLLISGCSSVSKLWDSDKPAEAAITGFLGAVVADEPRAAMVGRGVLASGGTAADAAVAVAATLWVTLPSRAGIGGGGACLVHNGDERAKGVPEAVIFMSQAPGSTAGADRPAAAPMMPRGLFLLNARYGKARFESIMGGVEQMARDGVPASRALVRDLAVVAGPLAGDPGARAVFFPGGKMIGEGETLAQPELAALLGQMRRAGVGDLYSGAMAQKFIDAAGQAGGGITAADLRAAMPRQAPALSIEGPDEATVSFLPAPADGGVAAAAAYRVLASDASALRVAKERALAAAAESRGTGALGALSASTSFAVIDSEGNAVACALTMGNLFGTGRMAQGTGVLLAAAPSARAAALLSAGMLTFRRSSTVRAIASGSGQDGAPVAVAQVLAASMADRSKVAKIDRAGAPEPGRVNIIACNGGVSEPGTCAWSADPRGYGLAMGSN